MKRKHGRLYISRPISEGIKKNKKKRKKHGIFEMHGLKRLLIWFDLIRFDLTSKHRTHSLTARQKGNGALLNWLDWLTDWFDCIFIYILLYFLSSFPSSSLSFFDIQADSVLSIFLTFLFVFCFFPRYLIFLIKSVWLIHADVDVI